MKIGQNFLDMLIIAIFVLSFLTYFKQSEATNVKHY